MRGLDTTLPRPSDGMSFRHAMVWYGHKRVVAEYRRLDGRAMIKQGTEGALFAVERSTLGVWRDALVHGQLLRLRSGAQRATGVMPGTPTAVNVPREWWQNAIIIGLDENTATEAEDGSTVGELRIFPGEEQAPEAPEQAPPVSTPKKRGRPNVKQLAVEQRMRADITSGKHTLADLQELQDKQLAAEYSVSAYTANRALRAVAAILGN